MAAYAELRCKSNFSFLRGASHPEELVARAAELGLSALAVTDVDGLHGAVRAHAEARRTALPVLVGAEITCSDLGISGDRARPLVLLARDRDGYANLCRILTSVHCGGPLLGDHAAPERPDVAAIPFRTVAEGARGLFALYPSADGEEIARVRDAFGRRLALAVSRHRVAGEEVAIAAARTVGRRLAIPVVVTNDVHTADRRRQPLQDVLTCIRLGTTVDRAGRRLFSNAERTLKGPEEMAQLWRDFPEGLEASVEIASQCRFRLDEIRGEHPLPPIVASPREIAPSSIGSTAPDTGGVAKTGIALLRDLVEDGARWRWKGEPPESVRLQIARELDLVEQLGYASYFLTVWDIVRFARSRGILCQGRGSAANSVLCYCLGITSIDPVRMGLLFERFISVERGEPPDIDVDFEHERREEVIQYVYERYGRAHAGLVCEVISYRARSAIRDVGKALGLSLGQVDRLAKLIGAYEDVAEVTPELLAQAGLDGAASPVVRQTLLLSNELQRFPRHISTHVGGFIITSRPLCETVPLEPAAMPGRTIVQWDKDDIAEMGLLKVDLLGLGMLSALSRSLRLLAAHRPAPRAHHATVQRDATAHRDATVQRDAAAHRDATVQRAATALGDAMWPDSLAAIPAEDPEVYAMISRADTIGVFQIESRAQMSLLPRLRPRCFYDLVISVAIIRPGPIQGGMIHPFLRRRDGLEPVKYPYEPLRAVLEKTLGVPLFQEQAMRLAIVAAGFTPGEADELRRVMTHKRSHERMESMRSRLVAGMAQRGISAAQSDEIFRQLLGFAGYGFPESHAASFALLVYASAWIKRYHPAVFASALLDSQPMGFYAPHTIVEDAKRHGVEVRGVDVQHSSWESTLEGAEVGQAVAPAEAPALRLGLAIVKGLPRAAGEAVVQARQDGPFTSTADLAHRAGLSRAVLARLAEAGALRSIAAERHEALWGALSVTGASAQEDLFAGRELPEPQVKLPVTTAAEEVVRDYATTGLSDRAHPMAMIRPALASRRIRSARELARLPDGARVDVAGLVIIRQRPQTASGIVFVSLEDETGIANLVVMPDVYEKYRVFVRGTSFLVARGRVERNGAVVNVRVSEVEPLRPARDLSIPARDFR
ncbi:MAG TPA: error-prone DNA polymerase [Anaeromyxobacteraceae bacterium]|nr:error-prone DNA polymerase [Anaeromyxobacteraceae bacterium]